MKILTHTLAALLLLAATAKGIEPGTYAVSIAQISKPWPLPALVLTVRTEGEETHVEVNEVGYKSRCHLQARSRMIGDRKKESFNLTIVMTPTMGGLERMVLLSGAGRGTEFEGGAMLAEEPGGWRHGHFQMRRISEKTKTAEQGEEADAGNATK